MAHGVITVRVADGQPVRALVEAVVDAIGALENGDHYGTQEQVAEDLRDALAELKAAI